MRKVLLVTVAMEDGAVYNIPGEWVTHFDMVRRYIRKPPNLPRTQLQEVRFEIWGTVPPEGRQIEEYRWEFDATPLLQRPGTEDIVEGEVIE